MMESGFEYRIEEKTKENIFWGFVGYFGVIGIMLIIGIILTIIHWRLHWNLLKAYWYKTPILTSTFACSVILMILVQIYLKKLIKRI